MFSWEYCALHLTCHNEIQNCPMTKAYSCRQFSKVCWNFCQEVDLLWLLQQSITLAMDNCFVVKGD